MMVGTFGSPRRQQRKDFEEAMEAFREDLGVMVGALREEQASRASVRRGEHPSTTGSEARRPGPARPAVDPPLRPRFRGVSPRPRQLPSRS